MVEGPVAHQASTPPRTALREALLNGFSGAVAGVLRHRIGGGRNGLWDTLATCLSDAPKAYVDAPWWASPTFRRGRGGSLVRYCRMSGLLMQRLLAAGRMVFVRSDPNRESGLKGPPPYAICGRAHARDGRVLRLPPTPAPRISSGSSDLSATFGPKWRTSSQLDAVSPPRELLVRHPRRLSTQPASLSPMRSRTLTL